MFEGLDVSNGIFYRVVSGCQHILVISQKTCFNVNFDGFSCSNDVFITIKLLCKCTNIVFYRWRYTNLVLVKFSTDFPVINCHKRGVLAIIYLAVFGVYFLNCVLMIL